MFETILYLQANEQIAQSIKDEFDPESYEVLIASSAQEAFIIFDERQVTLTLVDTFVPDMKLIDFIDRIEANQPDMILNVCIDVVDSKLISNLTRRKSVKKIHTIPWEITEIVEGVVASIDSAIIADDFAKRKEAFEKEEEQFEKTLSRLKDSLKRQQYSYNVIAPFYNSVIKAFASKSGKDPQLLRFMNDCCNKMLRLQTATTIKTSILDTVIRDNISELSARYENITVGEFDNCIIGNVSKDKLADLTFCIWLCVYLEAVKGERGPVDIFTRYVTSTKCEIRIVFKNWERSENPDDYDMYVSRLLLELVDEFDTRAINGETVYELRMSL